MHKFIKAEVTHRRICSVASHVDLLKRDCITYVPITTRRVEAWFWNRKRELGWVCVVNDDERFLCNHWGQRNVGNSTRPTAMGCAVKRTMFATQPQPSAPKEKNVNKSDVYSS